MSGIAGIYNTAGLPVERATIARMMAPLAHRGPDGHGIWTTGSVGLGHQQLCTTPESVHEHLPLTHQSGQFTITADARIDNRRELQAQLMPDNSADTPITDTDLILAAYEKWGSDCPVRLVGDFAFAIWDAVAQKLFCARDCIGVKPFYYHHVPTFFAFASETKALLSLPEIPCRLNETRVADHLVGIFEDKAITFYEGIYRLPPAHSLTLDHHGLRIRRYWRFDPETELHLDSDAAYAEAFRAIFTEAVHCRMRSAFPVGSTLSGGLDSSSIVCTARSLVQPGNQPLHTFSALFTGLPEVDRRRIDESSYIQTVVNQGDLTPHYVQADQLGPLHELDQVLDCQGEVFLAPNQYIHWALYKLASAHQVRVFLDGIDGDTTISHGLENFAELTRTGRWWTLRREARHLAAHANANFPPWRIVWQYGLEPLLPTWVRRGRHKLSRQRQPEWAEGSAIKAAFSQRIGLAARMDALLARDYQPFRTARHTHWQSFEAGLIPYTLELADRAAAKFGIEPRYPFFDRRLMSFCLSLPADQKLRQGWTRWILRRSMQDILPPRVQWRTLKANLSPNFMRRLLDFNREILDAMVWQSPPATTRYVDMATLRTLYQRYLTQPMQSPQEAITVYGAVLLRLWLSQSGLAPSF